MSSSVRRIVTGHDGAGKAVVLRDEALEAGSQREGAPPAVSRDLWINRETPADLALQDDPIQGPIGLQPPAGGAAFRVVWFMPEETWRAERAGDEGRPILTDIGARDPGEAARRHPMMHRTDTIDYAVCMAGECVLMLDDSEVTVRAGDTVVQLGNNHAWANRSKAPCQIAFVMIDAVPPGR